MISLISVLFVLSMAYSQYRQAKRTGEWSWKGFLIIFGSTAVLVGGFLIPLVRSTTMRAHVALMMTAIFGGILLFVATLIYGCRRYYASRGYSFHPEPPVAPAGTTKGDQSTISVLAMVCICAGAMQAHAQGKQVYSDPGGAYTVNIPAGWQTQAQPGSPMISIVDAKTKVSVTLGVMRGPEANTPTAEKELEGVEQQFPQSCPQAKVEQRGPTKLAGLNGSFLLVHCNGASGPELMKFAAASRPGVVALMVTASPGDAFLKVVVPLESIKNSFKALPAAGMQENSGPIPGAGGQSSMQGADDAQAPPQGQPQAGGQFPSRGDSGSDASHNSQGRYSDPQGRYSLAVPPGWNTANDNGNLTLSSGASWVTVATGTGAQPSDVNQKIVQQIQAQYKDFKVLNQGDFQNNGHAAHGTNATGVNPKRARVSVLVVSISAGGGNYLVLISSAPNDQAQQINGTVMQIAQSVKFAGE
ncbi:MAG TPA: hypothetical protein VGG56_08605 [Terracidiphilus sp.]|jgi:hypothetical protein